MMMQTSDDGQRHQPNPTRSVSVLALAALIMLSAAGLGAQTAVAGTGNARLALQTKLRVGYHLKVRQDGPARVLARTSTRVEAELPVTAASNGDWALSVALPVAAEQSAIEVLDGTGQWRILGSGESVAVLTNGQPTNGQPVTIQLRLPPGSDLTELVDVRLLMTPADGAR